MCCVRAFLFIDYVGEQVGQRMTILTVPDRQRLALRLANLEHFADKNITVCARCSEDLHG